ncbi:MAG: hypothetical protein ABJA67_06795, partial [Chthonomonadales bacterium]
STVVANKSSRNFESARFIREFLLCCGDYLNYQLMLEILLAQNGAIQLTLSLKSCQNSAVFISGSALTLPEFRVSLKVF